MSVLERIQNGELAVIVHHEKVENVFLERNPDIEECDTIVDLDATAELLQLATIGERMRWIPVSEGLPDEGDTVDVFARGWGREASMTVDSYESKLFFRNDNYTCDLLETTHWRPSKNDKPEVDE